MFSPKKGVREVMDALLNLMGGIFPQCIHVSTHHIVNSKYPTILSIDLNKAGKEKKKKDFGCYLSSFL